MSDWCFFHGDGKSNPDENPPFKLPTPPPWRQFGTKEELIDFKKEKEQENWQKLRDLAKKDPRSQNKGETFRIYTDVSNNNEENPIEVINAVNAAIYLRRPLLVTGKPGSGKTSLAYAIAYELNLGPVLSWPITARSTLQDGLYRYDPIARLYDTERQAKLQGNLAQEPDIGNYIELGPVGTAFLPSELPRVLLIDEIDKSDINLPNDLLNLFEEGKYNIEVLVRRKKENDVSEPVTVRTQDKGIEAVITDGWIRCYEFPIIVMTSNGERDFPPAFLRRCIRVKMPDPQKNALTEIVKSHLESYLGTQKYQEVTQKITELIGDYLTDDNRATDQLLNTIYLLTQEVKPDQKDEQAIKDLLLKRLDSSEDR